MPVHGFLCFTTHGFQDVGYSPNVSNSAIEIAVGPFAASTTANAVNRRYFACMGSPKSISWTMGLAAMLENSPSDAHFQSWPFTLYSNRYRLIIPSLFPSCLGR